jgi:hypothetical protein
MAKNAQRVKDKFQQRVAASAGEYAAGVQDPSKPWLASYVRASDKMKAQTMAALNENRHVKGAQSAGDQKWKDRAADVGAQRYGAAATTAAENFGAVLNDVLAAGDAGNKAAEAMPDATPEQREQRALASMRAIKNYWRSKKGLGK